MKKAFLWLALAGLLGLGHGVVIPSASAQTAPTSWVKLSWTSAGAGLTYNLYRTTTTGTGYVKIATQLKEVSFVDQAPGTGTVYYALSTVDASGNESAKGSDVTVVLPASPKAEVVVIGSVPAAPVVGGGGGGGTVALQISAVTVTNLTADGTGATINWTSSVVGDSQVGYSVNPSTNFRQTTCCAPAGVTSHSVVLTGLSPSTTYNYVVESVGGTPSVQVVSTVAQFTTATPTTGGGGGGGGPALTVSTPSISVITQTGATVTWTTNNPANTAVGYAVSPSLTYIVTAAIGERVTSHSFTLNGLAAGTTYNIEAVSYDGSTVVKSSNASFSTLASGGGGGGGGGAAGPVHAFPTAQGGGANAVGGRGGQVFEVTNTHDSGPGSLRACIEANVRRTCIFRIAGVITNASRLAVSNPFITIAGQSAPGQIILKSASSRPAPGDPQCSQGTCETLWVTTHDVITQYITYDGSSNTPTGPDSGTVGFADVGDNSVYNIMWDHDTVRWAGNKSFVVEAENGGGPHLTTIQWSLLYEPTCSLSGLPNTCHPVGIGTLYVNGNGGGCGTCTTEDDAHHNMFVNVDHRLPLNQSGRNTRWVNNIIYNWGQFAALSMGGIQSDYIGNKYVDGSGARNFNYQNVHVFLANGNGCDSNDATGDCGGNNETGPTLYMLNNLGHAGNTHGGAMVPATHSVNDSVQISLTAQGWEGGETGDSNSNGPIPGGWFRSSPLPAQPFPIIADPAENLDNIVPATVGNYRRLDCNGNWIPSRDNNDTRVINEYNQRQTGTQTDMYHGQYSSTPPVTGTVCQESMHDGVPDQWKSLHGISLSTPGSQTAPNGYTYLENYLNGTDPKK